MTTAVIAYAGDCVSIRAVENAEECVNGAPGAATAVAGEFETSVADAPVEDNGEFVKTEVGTGAVEDAGVLVVMVGTGAVRETDA